MRAVLLDSNGSGTTSGSIVTKGQIAPGMVHIYQQRYRDPGPASPCGTDSSLTQAPWSAGSRVPIARVINSGFAPRPWMKSFGL